MKEMYRGPDQDSTKRIEKILIQRSRKIAMSEKNN